MNLFDPQVWKLLKLQNSMISDMIDDRRYGNIIFTIGLMAEILGFDLVKRKEPPRLEAAE